MKTIENLNTDSLNENSSYGRPRVRQVNGNKNKLDATTQSGYIGVMPADHPGFLQMKWE